MMKSSLFSNLLARPEKLLRDHIQRVSELCSSLCLESKLNLDSINLKQDKMARTLELIGWCHDFVRQLYFSRYIQEKDDSKEKKAKNKKKTHHSLISCCFLPLLL